MLDRSSHDIILDIQQDYTISSVNHEFTVANTKVAISVTVSVTLAAATNNFRQGSTA